MAISVDCSNCGKTLRAKDSAAGKTARCPSCQQLITIPAMEEVYDAEEAGSAEDDSRSADEETSNTPAVADPSRRPCPACGEMIAEAARKCRHCGEIFDEDLKRRSRRKGSSRSRNQDRLPLADPGKRFLGAMADRLIMVVLLGPGIGIVAAGGDPSLPGHDNTLTAAGGLVAILGLLVLGSLNIYLLATRSQSIGKYLVKTQIINYETDEPAGFARAWLLRGFVNGSIGCVLMCCFYAGIVYFLVDDLLVFGEDHRCIHDQIAGTYVADIS